MKVYYSGKNKGKRKYMNIKYTKEELEEFIIKKYQKKADMIRKQMNIIKDN